MSMMVRAQRCAFGAVVDGARRIAPFAECCAHIRALSVDLWRDVSDYFPYFLRFQNFKFQSLRISEFQCFKLGGEPVEPQVFKFLVSSFWFSVTETPQFSNN